MLFEEDLYLNNYLLGQKCEMSGLAKVIFFLVKPLFERESEI
jgi:hypothetical protein